MFNVRVTNFRAVSFTGVVGFFDLELGEAAEDGTFSPAMVLYGYALKPRKAGGYWVQPPGKPRMKDGQPVIDEKGFKVYDPYYDLYLSETTTGGKALSASSKALRQEILAQAEAALNGNSSRGRGTAGTTTTQVVGVGAQPEDDDLPF